METRRVGRSPGRDQTPSLVPATGGSLHLSLGLPHPRLRQPAPAAHSGAPSSRYPAPPLPPLLGRESGSGRPRILPSGPASCASHPLARDPWGEGRRLEGPMGRVHLRWGGCLRDRDASQGTLVQTLQLRAPLLATGPAGVGRRAPGAGGEPWAGGGAAWSPSNRGTPWETPLRSYAMTQGGGVRGLSLRCGSLLRPGRGLR